MVDRNDVHRLVDVVSESRLSAVERLLRVDLDVIAPGGTRDFASTGMLEDEHDLAERCEELLRGDPGPADGRTAPQP